MPDTLIHQLEVLFVAWQNPADRRYYPVARLVHNASSSPELFEFAYIHGARTAAKEAGFTPFLAFPNIEQVYVSQELFPFFLNRLLPRSRPEYDDFVSSLELDPAHASPLQILGRSGGGRVTDNIELFALPTFDSESYCYCTAFLVHGLRHMPVAAQERVLALKHGEQLPWYLDVQNPAEPWRAMGLRTEDRHNVGFIPTYLLDDVQTLLDKCFEINVHVLSVNLPPTPLAQRLLCELRSCWPEKFKPYASQVFQTIAPDAIQLSGALSARQP